MSETLEDFLGKPEPEPAPEPQQREPEQQAEAPKPDAEPEAPKPEGEPPEPQQQDDRRVPLAALESERKARQDYKERAARAEAERDMLMKQLEEAKRAPVQPEQRQQQFQAPQLPDPQTNPAGYISALIEHQRVAAEQMIIHERFNNSELRLRQQIGDEQVDALLAEFEAAAAQDESLRSRVGQQRDPFAWAHKEMQARKLQAEVGSDPEAYKARLRAEWEAETQGRQTQQTQPQQPTLPPRAPSLANTRSAAPRAAATFTGPTPLEDILGR